MKPPPRRRPPPRRADGASGRNPARAGFTLVELMVVIGIMGLVLAIGIPTLFRVAEKDALRSAVTTMVEACHAARAHAILNGEPATLTLRPAERSFEAPGKGPFTIPDSVTVVEVSVNFVDVRDFSTAPVRFYPNGTSDEFTIVFASARHEQRFIELDCVTALPRVETEENTRYAR